MAVGVVESDALGRVGGRGEGPLEGDGALRIRSRFLRDECRETGGVRSCWLESPPPRGVGGRGPTGGGKGEVDDVTYGCLEGSGIVSNSWFLPLLEERRWCFLLEVNSTSSGRGGRLPDGGGFGVIMDNLNARCATEFRNVVYVAGGEADLAS